MAPLLTTLYNIVVAPLVYVIECVFSVMFRLLGDPGWAVVGVSLVVNLLCAPLYAMADSKSREERERQASMARWVDHIKRTFKGDERFMMLSTYYREKGYRQIYALSSSFSLLLQVPIFIAAYRCLSGLAALKGASFGPIADLGAPDGMLMLGGTAVNALPIIMTALNCASTFVYTRGFPLAEKLQAYGLAALFLVLLYKSPSGLVLYWTCNQVFSLVRNVLGKLTDGGRLRLPGSDVVARLCEEARLSIAAPRGAKTAPAFVLAALLLTALTAVLVPSALMSSSPDEFITASGFGAPLELVGYALCVLGGLFVLWMGVYYYLAGEEGRSAIALGMVVVACSAVVNYFLFAGKLGIINADLTYEVTPYFDLETALLNAGALIAVAIACVFAWKNAYAVVSPFVAILLVGVVGLSIPNIATLIEATGRVAEVQARSQMVVGDEAGENVQDGIATTPVPFDEEGNPVPVLHLSREGRNVVIIYLDRAMSAYVPYMVNERPELAGIFDGFTYYPNIISFGTKTVFGSPAVMGGYEYTPSAINARADELLVDKHNEALRVMPTLFSQAGFQVTLFDTPLTDYQFSNYDYSIFDGIPNVKAYHSTGAYKDWYLHVASKRGGSETLGETEVGNLEGAQEAVRERFERDICYYGLFRVSPVFLRTAIYDDGAYLAPGGDAVEDDTPLPLAVSVVRTIGRPILRKMAAAAPDAGMVARVVAQGEVEEFVEPEDEVAYDEWGNPIYPEGSVTYDEWGNPIVTEGTTSYDEWGNVVESPAVDEQAAYGRRTDHVINNEFLSYYSALAALPTITTVDDGAEDHFVFFGNSITHTPDLLLVPDYVPSTYIDNSLYANEEAYTIDGQTLHLDTETRQAHYQSNMAAWLRIGEWLEQLKAEGVYDNTRIILVSDHGHGLGQIDSLNFEGKLDAQYLNPLLAVKDFGSHGNLASDYTFMTNADCPLIALGGLVENPVNPFTGNPMNADEKYAHDQLVTMSLLWDVATYQTGTVFDTSDASWFTVHDDVYVWDNWQFAAGN